jgi:hypothetical protein
VIGVAMPTARARTPSRCPYSLREPHCVDVVGAISVCEHLDGGRAQLLLVSDAPSLVGTDRAGPVERHPSHSLVWMGMSHNQDIVGAHLVEYVGQRFTGFDDHDHRFGSPIRRTLEVVPQRVLGGAFCEQRLQEHLVAARITVHGADLGAYPHAVDNGFQMFDPRGSSCRLMLSTSNMLARTAFRAASSVMARPVHPCGNE